MPVEITLTIEARDAQGKRTHTVPGIADLERATAVAHDLFEMAHKRAELAELEATLSKAGKPKTKAPRGPAYVPIAGLENGGKCGWYRETRTSADRYCIKDPEHGLKPGMGAGHLFEEPTPAKVKA